MRILRSAAIALGLAAGFPQQAASVLDVIGIADERDGNVVRSHLRGQLDVRKIVLRQAGNGEPSALQVETLAV